MKVEKFLRFLPVGPYKHEQTGHLVDRKLPLIQIVTNPPGIRTLAVGTVKLVRPST